MMKAKLGAAAFVLFTLGASLFALAAQAVTSAAPGAQDTAAVTLTLEQVVARAETNQPLILQAQAAVEAARARVGQAQSAYFPSVSATGTYTLLEPDQSLTLAFPAPIGPLSFSLVPINNWDFNVGLRQILFQFGRRGVQVKLAENGVSAARIGVDQIKASIAFQAAQGFYTVLFLQEEIKALNEQLQNLQEHLHGTQVKEQTGSATRYDVLSTSVRVSVQQSQIIEAQNQYQKQSIALKQLLGIDESAEIRPSGGFTPGSGAASDTQAQIAAAMAQRPEVRQAVETENAAELSKNLALTAALPTISAHAAMGSKNGIATASNTDINALVFDWNAGVQVNVPIFSGFLAMHALEEADKRMLAARENTAAVKRSITTQVLQALQDADAARQQVLSAQFQLDQATEMLHVVKLQYDLGMLTNLEYLDAQAALERAQLGSLQAQYRAVLGDVAVKQALGADIGQAKP